MKSQNYEISQILNKKESKLSDNSQILVFLCFEIDFFLSQISTQHGLKQKKINRQKCMLCSAKWIVHTGKDNTSQPKIWKYIVSPLLLLFKSIIESRKYALQILKEKLT